MNEEELFTYTDQLMLEARESHRELISSLDQGDIEDLIEELRLTILEHDTSKTIDWSRVFILAVFGEMYDLNS